MNQGTALFGKKPYGIPQFLMILAINKEIKSKEGVRLWFSSGRNVLLTVNVP
jgi:hypothetical protein